MSETRHEILGGEVSIYKRENSKFWQCSSFLSGRNRRISTGEESLARAKDFALDWYLELRGKQRSGTLGDGKKLRDAAATFLREYQIITEGTRNPTYVEGHQIRLNAHLLPFFGDTSVRDITAGHLQNYRIHRHEKSMAKWGRAPARNTIHQEIVTLRLVLKTALRHQWIDYLPDLSEPYQTRTKISHRAWFSPQEYRKLYLATRERAENPKNKRWVWESEQLHDLVLFLGNTGVRPDEAARLEFRDVAIVRDQATNETILEIQVRGKRGVGYCKSTAGAVLPFRRLKARDRLQLDVDGFETMGKPEPTDRLFPSMHHDLLNAVLEEQGLKFDREGNRRTAYSLRHTYICLRLMEGADIYQIAKNCRTSVEMIQKYYAAHLKTTLDAAAINVRRPRPERKVREPKRTRGARDREDT